MANRRRRRRSSPSKRRERRSPAAGQSFLGRRSTKWLIAAIATLTVGIVLGVVANQTGGDGDGDASPTPTLAPGIVLPDLDVDETEFERAEVLDVIDGDTIDVRLNGSEERVRYFGVDTPERGTRCFDDATERNEALAGDAVLLLPDVRERDQFDRLLRYAFDEDGDSIDARLIAEGLAEAWEGDGAYRDELVELAEQAQAESVGCLWE